MFHPVVSRFQAVFFLHYAIFRPVFQSSPAGHTEKRPAPQGEGRCIPVCQGLNASTSARVGTETDAPGRVTLMAAAFVASFSAPAISIPSQIAARK